MDRGLAVILTAVVGGIVAAQAPINSRLGATVGTFQAAVISFVVGLVALVAIMALASGGFGDLARARDLPWYYLTGGLLGAAYITAVLVTVRTLGVGGVTVVTVAAQLVASAVIDHFALLGIDRHPLTIQRLAGFVLLGAGALLVVNDQGQSLDR